MKVTHGIDVGLVVLEVRFFSLVPGGLGIDGRF
jgi:hypothetical protein